MGLHYNSSAARALEPDVVRHDGQTMAALDPFDPVFSGALQRLAQAFVATHQAEPRIAALFATEQRWLLCHAALGAHFRTGGIGRGLTRPVLVEIQALVVRLSSGATPRRAVVGWDSGRLAMILAVLEARCGVQIGANDVYLNVAGGLRVTEPAADLAIAAALVSSLSNVPVPSDMVIFGEIGLSGEIRTVGQLDKRLKEAAKLGFRHAMIPSSAKTRDKKDDLRLTPVPALKDILPLFSEEA